MRRALILLVFTLAILISPLVQAQNIGGGCCFDAATGECMTVPSTLVPDETACRATTGSAFVANDCPALSQCNLGCCCFSNGQTQSTIPAPVFSCHPGAEKRETVSTTNCQDLCALPPQTFIVKGQVTNRTGSVLNLLRGASVSVPNLDKQDVTDTGGNYLIRNIPASTLQDFIASFPGCVQVNQSINVTQDLTNINFELDCTCTPEVLCDSFLTAPCIEGIQTIQCRDENDCQRPFNRTQTCEGPCTADSIGQVTITDIKPVPRKPNFLIDWVFDSSCKGQETIKNTVMRCNDAQTNCAAIALTTETHYEDNGTAPNPILPETTYCYQIRSQFFDGSVKNSEFKCITSGDAACLTQSGSEFCLDNQRTTCDAQNKLQTIEDCGETKFCLGPYPTGSEKSGQTECVNSGTCNKCNGLFEEFSYLDYLKAFIGFGSERELKKCTNSDPDDPGLVQQHICYLDTSDTIVDMYHSCSQVKKCGHYRSEKTCALEESKDPCLKTLDCQWFKVYGEDASAQLGLGICSSTTPTDEDCQSCSELLGGCTQTNCELIGGGRGRNCYFDGDPNGLESTKGCAGKEKIICRDYDTQEDCEGGQAVQTNAQYNENKTRIGGTHELVPSSDLLGFGRCFWDPNNNRCERNADALADKDCTSLTDFTCQKDFAPPITQINIPLTPLTQRPAFNEQVIISVNVQDNTYASSLIGTFYCVINATQICYPNINIQNRGGHIEENLNTSGRYKVFYYSFDPAKNLEVIQQAVIEIDLDAPVITLDTVDNTTNESQIGVTGHVSEDTVQLCAENSALPGTKRCIVPCSV
ncbi:MAG TPA: hypothetical protein VJG90_03640, partial [Candidatus Nanoarchaeia archaeon]|nr:hypothetical protein [Candidatus Nanoarchaeia archaeon]